VGFFEAGPTLLRTVFRDANQQLCRGLTLRLFRGFMQSDRNDRESGSDTLLGMSAVAFERGRVNLELKELEQEDCAVEEYQLDDDVES
jgi:hypothetical protein